MGLACLSAVVEVACSSAADHGGSVRANDSVAATLSSDIRDENDRNSRKTTSADSSPFITGVWKFIRSDAGTPSVDTEFRFINPTSLTVTLEYAFFEADTGVFCGCDRDTLTPNKTTIYTVLGEAINAPQFPTPSIPFQFSCQGTSGALKAIVFKNKGERIFLDDATQVGFQTHAFGGIQETSDGMGNFNFLVGTVMTEAPMVGVAISDSTREDVRIIHDQCTKIIGPLVPKGGTPD
jgi:hypothetical protein